MKWENRDVKVVEWANLPKFSKLDHITTLRFLKLFFDDVLVDMIVGCTKLYSHREQEKISFEIMIQCLVILLESPSLWQQTN